jgi:hypothetical protein
MISSASDVETFQDLYQYIQEYFLYGIPAVPPGVILSTLSLYVVLDKGLIHFSYSTDLGV